MKDFLTAYYNRLIFSEMSHEQFVQFCGYIRDKKATDNQKIWAEELLEKDPATGEFIIVPNTEIYDRKKLPDPEEVGGEYELNEDEWKKLFKAFRAAFQSMDGSKNDFKYNDKAKEFFETYFGTNPSTGLQNMFQHEKVKPSVEDKLYKAPPSPSAPPVPGTLYAFLKKYKHLLEARFSGGYYSIITDDFSYDDLLKGITEGKYNSKASFRKKLEAVAGYIEGYKVDLIQAGIPSNDMPDLSDYQDWYDARINPFRLVQFKREYRTLLDTLRHESKIREVFEQHDNGKITGPLNKAITNQSYDDPKSDDYVQPKREDTLTMPERLAEWWSDTYSDCLEKYVKLKGDRLFFSDEAKSICKYLQKDLKKTDGLDGVLKNIGAAKEKLQGAREFKAKKHLEWFEKTMNGLKNDPKLEKVWAGALKNGTHMQALVKEIIIRAIKEGKKDEAKTAMELISVLHYDYTTSKVMDILSKENLSVFSDTKLSWNKNEGIKMVTAALDKGIKWAFMGIGYGITMAGNAYKLSGRKIKRYSDKSGNLAEEHKQYLKKQQADKRALEDLLSAERTQQTTTQTDVNLVQGTKTYDVAKSDLERDLATAQGSVTMAADDLRTKKEDLFDIMYDPTTGTLNPPITPAIEATIQTFLNNLTSTPLPTVPAGLPTVTVAGTTYNLSSVLNDILNAQLTLNTYTTNRDKKQNDLDTLVNGTELLNQLSDQITRHEDEVANWDNNHMDEMEELVKYWNMLETGRNTKTGPMYNWFRNLNAKSAQERLANQRNAIIADYNSSHSIAA